MKPLSQTSRVINGASEQSKAGLPVDQSDSAKKKPATMKVGTAQKSGDLVAPPEAQNTRASHSPPVITGRGKQRNQAITAKVVQDMLSDKDGPLNRQQLLEFSRSPITAKEVRSIPRTWPVQLFSAKDIWTWGDKLVKFHQKIFTKEGQQSYAKSVINAVFPDDANKPAHLPEKLEAFCLALDRQVIQQCRNSGLTMEEFDTLRMRVLGGFINGRVLCQHLRPKTISMDGKSGLQMDADLLAAAADKLNLYLDKLLSSNDALLAPVPAPVPKAQQTISPKMQIMKFLSAEGRKELAKSEYSDEFYKRATIYLNSSIKNKGFLITCLLFFYLKIPSDANNIYFSKLDKLEQFLYDERHTLDKLTREGRIYLLDQIDLMSFPDRRETLSKASLVQALNVAVGMLPTLPEINE